MSASSNRLVEVGVVLQGGGALGAYECGALNALLELMDEFAEQGRRIALKVVTGVSIGSINAACVVGAKSNADARARLNALWDDLTLETPPFWMQAAQRDLAYFGLPGFYVPRPDFWTAPTWTYVYGMECAISRRRPCSAAAATGSNSRATSCGPRSRIAGARPMRSRGPLRRLQGAEACPPRCNAPSTPKCSVPRPATACASPTPTSSSRWRRIFAPTARR